MIYELRVYEVAPGRLQALHDRFANHTTKFFQEHGIQVVGYWTEMVGTSNQMVYICAFDSLDDMEKKWAAFQADPGWQKARAESERDGPIVTRVHNKVLRPTSYSPLQ